MIAVGSILISIQVDIVLLYWLVLRLFLLSLTLLLKILFLELPIAHYAIISTIGVESQLKGGGVLKYVGGFLLVFGVVPDDIFYWLRQLY